MSLPLVYLCGHISTDCPESLEWRVAAEHALYEHARVLSPMRGKTSFKLEQGGLVESMPAEERRHPYRITSAGLASVEERLTESARIAKVGLKRIAGAL